ncbi:MAG: MATE family efflux transporter [Oscillospiraceae bacterium]|nr:MATE family efflux transporter [Oscillospiraceae bacterium]
MGDKQARLADNRDLTTGSIARKLLIFAWPILLGNIFTQLYNVADAIVVGRYVGPEALAAVGCVGSINMIVHSVLIGLGNGVGVVTSQFFGAKKSEELSKTVNTTFVLCLILGPILTVVGLLVGGPMLSLLGTPLNIIEDAHLYLNITFLGLMGMMAYHIGSFILRSVGDSKFPMYTLIASSVINIVLNVMFVVSFNMGVAGVAWATIIAQYLVAVANVIRILQLKIAEVNRKNFKAHRDIIAPVVKIGLPTGVQFMLTSLGMLVLQSFNNSFGSNMVATVTVMQKLDGFANMPAMALSTAAATFVGQNIGANKMDRVKTGVRYIMIVNIVVGVAVGAVMLAFGRGLLGLFTDSEEVITMGLAAVAVISFTYWANGVQQSATGIIRGAGAAVVPMIIMFITTVIRLPIAYFLAIVPGRYTGIFWSMFIAIYFGMIATMGYYFSGRWKNKGVVKHNNAADAE